MITVVPTAVCSVVFFPDMADDDTKAFFDLSEYGSSARTKIAKSMLGTPFPLYFGMGMSECGDIYDNIEAPLQGVIRRLLYDQEHHLCKDGEFDFNVKIIHVGNVRRL